MKADRMKQRGGVGKHGVLSILVGCLATLSGFGQSLIIEGGPNGARISNRDGKVEGPASSSNRQEITAGQNSSSPIAQGFSTLSPVWFQDITLSGASSQPPGPPTPAMRTDQDKPGDQPSIRVIDVGKQIRLNKMEREIGIQKSSAFAGLTYDADFLFEPGLSNVSDLVKPILDKLSEYLSVAEGKSISVTYRYKLNEDSVEMGSARAQALIGYLSEMSGIKKGGFVALPPQPSTRPVGKDGSFSADFRPEFKSLISVIVHRQ